MAAVVPTWADEVEQSTAPVDSVFTLNPFNTGPLASTSWDSLNLALAVDRWVQEDLQGAVRRLEAVDLTEAGGFARADRAAFLLGVAYLRLGNTDRFFEVAEAADPASSSPFVRWLAYARLLMGDAGSARSGNDYLKLPGAATLTAAQLLESGQAGAAAEMLHESKPAPGFETFHRYLESMAALQTGSDAESAWKNLIDSEAATARDRELVEIGLQALAAAQLANGIDPSATLARLPENADAIQVRSMLALAAGDTAGALEILDSPAQQPGSRGRRNQLLAAQLKVAGSHWDQALEPLDSATRDWNEESEWLEALEDPLTAASIWNTWSTEPLGTIPAPELNWNETVDTMADGAANLEREPGKIKIQTAPLATVTATMDGVPMTYSRAHRPDPAQMDQLARLESRSAQAVAERSRLERDLTELESEKDLRLDYLEFGHRQASGRSARLADALAGLELLLSDLDRALADLDSTRESALLQFASRTRAVAEDLRESILYVQAVRQFHVQGPASGRDDRWPASVPTPGDLLDLEQVLSEEIIAFVTLFGERTPELVNRSCNEIWAPRLAADGPALRLSLESQLRRSRDLEAAIDSTALALPIDREIAGARNRIAQKNTEIDSLATKTDRLQGEMLHQVIARGRNQLRQEKEAIDYLRGDALYWVAVQESGQTDENALAAARSSREAARVALADYLKDYPDGRARAESRYRLADLELLRARDDFQRRMAEFLGEKPSADDLQNKDLAPFVDYAPAIALYEKILAEDPAFPHRHAVLFQLGMILGDAGEPGSAAFLETLVAEHPGSPFIQEAWLRLGDQRFEIRDFAACRNYYVQAAAGQDPSLRSVALYKLGWARFELDQFELAAEAFGNLLDQYVVTNETGSLEGNLRRETDLQDEAREYLVHALIRAGGAGAFADHFRKAGPRPYEPEILIAMGHQLSGVSLYGEAIACDRMYLERFGDNDQALAVSERMVGSYRKWNKPDRAREVHLELAERFMPGQSWLEAHPDSSVQAEAETFAMDAYQRAAVHHHQTARKDDDRAEWRLALQYYDRYLETWPAEERAPRMHHQAGEAAHRLGLYGESIGHFQSAADGAGADTASFVREAAWQTVAVSDAWYREAGSRANATTGPDSLAHRLIESGAEFQARYPEDPELPGLLWRTGQVAYAHGWFDQAAVTLADLGRDFPNDPNALAAVRMSGDARYQLQDYPAAGATYQEALVLARQAGADSVAAELEPIIPRCHYQHAQQVAAADTTTGPIEAAPLFSGVANRWPGFEHADLALYRAGLGFEAGKQRTEATAAWEQLLARYPDSEYARDSAVQIAVVLEAADRPRDAAAALDRFSSRFPDDPDAAPALLKASDLLASAGDPAGSEAMKTAFLKRFPGETESVMAIREERALRALDGLTADQDPGAVPGLAAYLALAAVNPDHASPVILARVDFHKAEQAGTRYYALPLTQPLPASIEAKQKSLENLLALYSACAQHGVTEYTRAAAFRTGQAITHFGDALLASERPVELQGDDLYAYEEILEEQSWPFYDRGEAAWMDLLKQTVGTEDDPGQWLAQTREQLWPRVAQRFIHMPEADYPLVAAVPPEPKRADPAAGK